MLLTEMLTVLKRLPLLLYLNQMCYKNNIFVRVGLLRKLHEGSVFNFEFTQCYRPFPVWAWACSFPFLLSEPEGIFLGNIGGRSLQGPRSVKTG
jgi:hypothetical protein